MQPTTQQLNSIPFQYANDVRSGKIIVGKRIRQAIERFFTWIENAETKGYFLDHEAGMHIIKFFPLALQHTSSEVAGKPFILSPYQQFTVYNLFAWKRYDNKGNKIRVFRKVYEKVARKNGKTAVMSGIGLYCQAFDDEKGAEVYVGATMEKQAKLVWQQAVNFIKTSKFLKQCGWTYTQSEIRFEKNLSIFKPVSKQFQTLDGLRPSLGIIDEYHSHTTDGVKEVIQSGMGNRLQPILYTITTAGFNIASSCKAYEDVCKEILDGIKEDDSTLIMIHDLDEDDDWQDENNWVKANPNLGVSVSLDFLRTEFDSAINQISQVPNFKTKYLNMWVDADTVWIPDEVWMKNKVDVIPIQKFNTFGAIAALDLSKSIDITSFVAMSEPDENGNRFVQPFFFCPENSIDKRSKEDGVPYRAWRDKGLLISTPGDVVDYSIVESHIKKWYYQYNVKRIEVDGWNSSYMVTNLMEADVNVSEFGQGIRTMSGPTKLFETEVYEGKIKHDGNPILRWMLSGCILVADASENVKIHKGNSNKGKKRVDGIICCVMCIGGSMSVEPTNSSYYDKEGTEFTC
jgi:phage terminase large subunit-like protein